MAEFHGELILRVQAGQLGLNRLEGFAQPGQVFAQPAKGLAVLGAGGLLTTAALPLGDLLPAAPIQFEFLQRVGRPLRRRQRARRALGGDPTASADIVRSGPPEIVLTRMLLGPSSWAR